jgi:hypothetical protein
MRNGRISFFWSRHWRVSLRRGNVVIVSCTVTDYSNERRWSDGIRKIQSPRIGFGFGQLWHEEIVRRLFVTMMARLAVQARRKVLDVRTNPKSHVSFLFKYELMKPSFAMSLAVTPSNTHSPLGFVIEYCALECL